MEITDLTVEYDSVKVIDGLSLSINSQVVALMGPSGKGKTTLLKAIAGLIDYSGEIKDAQNTLILFQEDRLFPWLTVRQNAVLFAKDDSWADKWLERLGLAEVANADINTLSGGMQRRVSVAAMLCCEGDIYLLDEPTRGLDEQNANTVMECVLEKARGKTVIFSTHSQEIAKKYADRIIEL